MALKSFNNQPVSILKARHQPVDPKPLMLATLVAALLSITLCFWVTHGHAFAAQTMAQPGQAIHHS